MEEIIEVKGREILDSRGNPTLEVEVTTISGFKGFAQVPSGASKGKFEAVELRDEDERYFGKGVQKAIRNIELLIAPEILGLDVLNQEEVDRRMISLDGTKNKGKIGANAILGVSLAVARAASNFLGIPLYKYIGGLFADTLPVPFLNIINGGKHAENNLDIQEFLIAPIGFKNFRDAIRAGAEVYMKLKEILKKEGLITGIGDEGGFSPNLKNNEKAIKLIFKAIEEAKYKPGEEIFIALDCAASSFFKDGKYIFEEKEIDGSDLIEYYLKLIEKYPIISIEDPFDEEDYSSWKIFTKEVGNKIQIIGDDIFVTNKEKFLFGIENGIANSILIKLNQIGTLTETIEVINIARKYGYNYMISHRSGETTDTFIADFSVATRSYQIKSGAPARGERVAKYNRLIAIEEELEGKSRYGSEFLKIKR
ncbi:MAG: phosphopyruvate hydratase [Caldisericia bacterium]|nr:phosphopyruvate hydratase [Caldisericia bacterium]